ncbi:hypothetical protein KY285_008218 [Solanum tuberosum]|nr:hypothetical protein KY285_008218 [Solanum tuberosum]
MDTCHLPPPIGISMIQVSCQAPPQPSLTPFPSPLTSLEKRRGVSGLQPIFEGLTFKQPTDSDIDTNNYYLLQEAHQENVT